MNQTQGYSKLLARVTQAVVLIYQFLAAGVFIASLFFAYEWLQHPFIGGLFEHTMVIYESLRLLLAGVADHVGQTQTERIPSIFRF